MLVTFYAYKMTKTAKLLSTHLLLPLENPRIYSPEVYICSS